MLQLDFRNEAETLGELVAGEKHKPMNVKKIRHIARVEMRLTIGAEAEALIPSSVAGRGK